jgi:hypothetical protein
MALTLLIGQEIDRHARHPMAGIRPSGSSN